MLEETGARKKMKEKKKTKGKKKEKKRKRESSMDTGKKKEEVENIVDAHGISDKEDENIKTYDESATTFDGEKNSVSFNHSTDKNGATEEQIGGGEGGEKVGIEDSKDEKQDEGDENEPGGKRKRKRRRKKQGNAIAVPSEVTSNQSASNNTDNNTASDSIESTVYVEGIPFDSTEEEIEKFFVDGGCTDVVQMRLPKWQDTGRLRGYGHIVFSSTDSKQKALNTLNGQYLGTRYLSIREPNAVKTPAQLNGEPRDQPDGCKTVFVKNLPYEATEENILNIFRSCGKIIDGGVRLARNYMTGHNKGFAYVEFKEPEGAYAAVRRASKGSILIDGRMCHADYDEGRIKGSYRNNDGKNWQKVHPDGARTGSSSKHNQGKRSFYNHNFSEI